MKPRTCGACGGSGKFLVAEGEEYEACLYCGGAGQFWPSVEGEIVREEWARMYPGEEFSINVAGLGWFNIGKAGAYRVIIQPIKEVG